MPIDFTPIFSNMDGGMGGDCAYGYSMSNGQLNELWHFDMEMANLLMALPLRKCCAVPKALPSLPPMDAEAFQTLKNDVRTMWISASFVFTCQKGPFGWGLFFKEECVSNSRYVFCGIYLQKSAVLCVPSLFHYLEEMSRCTILFCVDCMYCLCSKCILMKVR